MLITSGKVLWADELLEEVLGNVRLLLIVGQPIAEPEAQSARLLRMLACVGADQEDAEL